MMNSNRLSALLSAIVLLLGLATASAAADDAADLQLEREFQLALKEDKAAWVHES